MLEARFDAAGRAVDIAGRKHIDYGEHLKKLKESVAGFGEKGVGLVFEKLTHLASPAFAVEAGAKIIEVTAEVGAEMVKTAAKAERTNKSFEMVFGAKGGAEMLALTEGMAKNTEFTSDALKGAVLQLGQAGFAGKDLLRANSAALDIASFSSDPAAGQSAAIASLSSIKSTGRVDSDFLAGLGVENTFFEELAKGTGESAATLKQKLQDGKVEAEQSLEALYAAISAKTGKVLGGAGADMSKTMSARLTHLSDLPNEYFQKLAKSEGFAKMSDLLGTVLEKLDPDGPVGKKIFGGLESAFNLVGELVSCLPIDDLFDELSDGFEVFSVVVDAITASLKVVHQVISAIDNALKGGNDWVNKWTPIGFLKDHGLLASDKAMSQDRAKNEAAATVNAPGATPAPAGISKLGAAALKSGGDASIPGGAATKHVDAATHHLARGGSDSSPAVPMFSQRGASQAARGAPHITIAPQVTVNVNGKADDAGLRAAAQAAGRAVVDLTVSGLQSSLDNLAIQAGAS